MLNPLVFIDIEQSLRNTVVGGMKSKASKVTKEVEALLKGEDEQGAVEALRSLEFTDVVGKALGHVEFLMMNALVYGASQASGTHNVGEGLLPSDDKEAVLEVFQKIATDRASAYIQIKGGQVISDYMDTVKESSIQKAELSLAERLNAAVDGNTQMFAGIAANLTTSRLSSFGFLGEARRLGIKKYQLQAVLDGKTSAICRRLNGRVFEVEQAYQHVEQVLKTRDPEDLKVIAPFVKGNKDNLSQLESSSNSDLQDKGIMVPPFHPGCRTILVKVGEVDTTTVSYTPISIAPIIDDKVTPTNSTELGGLSSLAVSEIRETVTQAISNGMTVEMALALFDPDEKLPRPFIP